MAGFAAAQLSGEALQAHSPVAGLQLSPAIPQVRPAHSPTQRCAAASHRCPAGQLPGVQAQAPVVATHASPAGQVTPWHLASQRRAALQRVVGSASGQVSAGSIEHSHCPPLGVQLSPGRQETPWHWETQRPLAPSQRVVGAAAVQESGETAQRQPPDSGSQLSPGTAHCTPTQSPPQLSVAVSHFWPGGQLLGRPQWHSPEVGTQASPVGQVTPRHFSWQRRADGSQRSAGDAAEQVSPGEEAHSHCPVCGLQLSPGAQLTPWQRGTQRRRPASQRQSASAALQLSGVGSHSQTPVIALHLSPGAAQPTPRQTSTQLRLTGSHFLPAGQVPAPQRHSPLVSTQASPTGQRTPRHLGSQRRVSGLQRSRGPHPSQTHCPLAASQRSPGLQALPWQRSTQRREASQTRPPRQLVDEQWHSPVAASHGSSGEQSTSLHLGTQRPAASQRPSGPQSSQTHAPVSGGHRSPAPQRTPSQRVAQRRRVGSQ